MTGVTRGGVAVVQTGSLFFFYQHLKKMQTLTKLLSFEFGKGPNIFCIFSSRRVLLPPPSPSLPRARAIAIYKYQWGGGGCEYGVRVYDYKSLFSNFHMLKMGQDKSSANTLLDNYCVIIKIQIIMQILYCYKD